MDISIFGLGYVGCVSLGCLAQNGHNVIGVDVSKDKVEQINRGEATIIEKDIDVIIKQQHEAGRISATTEHREAILNSEVSIVAVGTPSSPQGHLNLDYIFLVASNIGKVLKDKSAFHVVAIRSTVLPGTCDKFSNILEQESGKKRGVDFAVVDNPEFLREGSAVSDYYNPPLTLIGGESKLATDKIASLYNQLPGEVIIVETKVAEIMKYVNNTFHALKISFANEVGNVCSALNIDSHKVMEIFCKDKQLNISPYYFKPGFAYGGSCLPKDLKGFQTLAHDLYVKVPVVDSIQQTNDIQIQRAVSLLSKYFGKKVAVLGLSFKAGTDDLRNSPSVELVETMLGKGFDVSIYDKNIQLARLTGKNKEYIEKHIPHLTKILNPDIKKVIEESDVIVVCNKEEEFIQNLQSVSGKTVIDLVKLPESTWQKNNNYIGINW